jgi:RND family efflux transporter MFP subunit
MRSQMVRFLKFLLTRIFPAFLVLGLFIAGFMYLQSTKPVVEPITLEEKEWSVKATPVSFSDAQPNFRAYSTVKAMRQANLQMAAIGKIEFVSPNLKDGAILKKGELLVRLDTTRQILALADTDAKIEAEKINIASLEKQTELRRKLVDRVQKMKIRNVATDASLDEAELSLVITENQVSQSIARLRALEILRKNQLKDIEDAELVAPFTGSLNNVNIALGQRVTGASSFGKLTEINSAEVPFIVPAEIFVNADRLLNSKVSVIWKSGDDNVATIPATIRRYQSQVNKSDGGGTVFAELDVETATFIPVGAFVEVVYQGLDLEQVAVLPETALHENNQVYIVVNGRSVAKQVEIKHRSDGKIWISGDLEENDLIVSTRLPGLAAGMKVEISEIIDVE